MSKKQKKNLIRIIVAAVLMVILMIVQHAIGEAGGLAVLLPGLIAPIPLGAAKAALLDRLIWLILYLIPYLVVGYDILLKAWKGIKNRQPMDENLLMAIATLGAIALALYQGGDFTEAIAVMLFYQIGEWFQSYAVDRSRKNVAALMDICPEYANVEQEDGSLTQLDPDEVEVGSIIVVKPGERIPIDGVVIDGRGTLDTAALTGESVPRSTKPGDQVISGCISTGSAVLRIRTEKEYEDSTVARVLELIEDASSRKARSEKFISRFARVYTPIVVGAAVALAILPPLVRLALGMPPLWGTWVYRALIFLVISCPCALVVSIPLSFFAGIGGASRQGVLIKGANFLEILSQADTLVFDKTGTLTEGVFRVTKICPAAAEPETAAGPGALNQTGLDQTDPAARRLLRLAATAEAYSTHPIAESLRAAATEDAGLPEDATEIPGHGIRATIEGKTVWVGNARLMEAAGRTAGTAPAAGQPAGADMEGMAPAACEGFVAGTAAEEAGTVIHVAVDGVYAGYIVISDVVKPHSRDAIAAAKRAGVRRTVMLTGDVRAVAEKVAAELGIDQVYAELLPQDKVTKVEEMIAAEGGRSGGADGTGDQSGGAGSSGNGGEEGPDNDRRRMVAFVGDGINDAPVLSRADIGIAMGAMGSDAAVEAADVVLMDDDPLKIATAIRISRKCMRIVKQNIWFAIGVKVLCLILGAVGIANMWLAIFADVGVMVLAVLNAIRCMFIRGEGSDAAPGARHDR